MLSESKDAENQWDLMMSRYIATLNHWKDSYNQWQDVGRKALEVYADALQKANKEGNVEMTKKFNDLWSDTWNIAGKNNPYDWYLKEWENIWKNSGFVTSNAFNDYWQNVWQNNTEEFFRTSNEVMKKINRL